MIKSSTTSAFNHDICANIHFKKGKVYKTYLTDREVAQKLLDWVYCMTLVDIKEQPALLSFIGRLFIY
jgi:hypothetical protein